MGNLPQELIECPQDGVSLWLAGCEPLIEVVHVFYILSLIRNVVDASGDSSEETNPHLCRMAREVGVCGERYCYPDNNERTDRIFAIHREAAADGLLTAFDIQLFVKLDGHVFQVAPLKECCDGLLNAW